MPPLPPGQMEQANANHRNLRSHFGAPDIMHNVCGGQQQLIPYTPVTKHVYSVAEPMPLSAMNASNPIQIPYYVTAVNVDPTTTGPVGAWTAPQFLTQPPPAIPPAGQMPCSFGPPTTTAAKPEVVLFPVHSSPNHVMSPNSSMLSASPPASTATVNPLMNSTNMEVVWHGKFNELFAVFPHHWQLRPNETEAEIERCTVFKDSAKVRFLCKHCGNAWTSMKGRVIFWIQLNYERQSGIVYFKLFGQQCQKCNPGTFEHAMWYPEEVMKVVYNAYMRVGQLYYGFQQPVMSVARRTGRPRTQHNSRLCQACAMNICREGFGVHSPAVPMIRA